MSNMKEYFAVTYVSREDISNMGYKNVENLSDEDMEKIARKMEGMYLENGFYEDLRNVIDEYFQLDEE